jgi:hypothetical protein
MLTMSEPPLNVRHGLAFSWPSYAGRMKRRNPVGRERHPNKRLTKALRRLITLEEKLEIFSLRQAGANPRYNASSYVSYRRGRLMRWFSLVVVSIATVFAGAACGGDSTPKEASKEPAKVEETTQKKEQGSDDVASVDCQLDKAEADLGKAGAEELMSEWYRQEVEPRVQQQDFSSALAEAKDLPTFLAERGYTC